MKKRNIKGLSILMTLILMISMFSIPTFAANAKLATPKISVISYSTPAFKVSWKAVDGANSYYVYRCEAGQKSMKLIAKTTKLYYKDKAVVKNVVYSYRVRAYNVSNGKKVSKSDLSNTIKKAVANVEKPKNVNAKTVSGTEIKVSWNKAEGAESYNVYYSTSKDGTYKLLANTKDTSYNCKGLMSSVKYYFKVKSVKLLGGSSYTSAYSTSASAKTQAKNGEFIVDFKKISNKEAGLPTGSAMTCLSMLLTHYGFESTPKKLVPYFNCSTENYYENGEWIVPNLDSHFFGDPTSNKAYSYGTNYYGVWNACVKYLKATHQYERFNPSFSVWPEDPKSFKPYLKKGNICLARVVTNKSEDGLKVVFKDDKEPKYTTLQIMKYSEKYIIVCGYTNDGYIVYDPALDKYEEYKEHKDYFDLLFVSTIILE